MKKFFTAIILFATLPVNAFDHFNYREDYKVYNSKNGYAFENRCFRFEYREYYIPGNSISPGYVKSYNEKVSVPCNIRRRTSNRYYQKPKPTISYTEYQAPKKCTTSTTLGGLLGGGIAATLSTRDAYAWAIPLGAVLGAGIGNAECN